MHPPAASVHHSEAYFNDPESFRPERFATEGGPEARSFLAFGAGARACPGERMALTEGLAVMAMLLRHYSWVLDPSVAPPIELMDLTMHASHMRLLLTPLHE